ncbi:hypothetical protein ACHAQJ_002269 [Trichoderma viride]
MDQHGQNSRQYTGNLSVAQAASTSSPSQLRHRPSFRDRFWARGSANYNGEDDVVHGPQVNPTKKSPYIPKNAASGFSKTATAPHEPFRPRNEKRWSKESAINVNASSPLSDLAAGHLYVHTEAESGTTDDYTDFITAAQTEDRLRRAANSGVHVRNHYRDSGYYSSSNGRHEHEPHSSSVPSSASAAGPKKLKSQPSMRAFSQRIAEYIKPLRDESVPPIRR